MEIKTGSITAAVLCLLVIGGSCVEHIRLQFGKEALLIFALTDLHVQQVWVDGRVVDLHQPLLNRLG